MDTTKRLLKKYWGYSSFLPYQEEIIESVLAGRDTLAIMATGGGKSLCYQLPALRRGGLALVISPLISLMKDQADDLNRRGIVAAAYTSTLDLRKKNDLLRILQDGTLRVLYLSPERCMQPQVINSLRDADIRLIAVDEAHCISEWGCDFRPEYRQLSRLKQQFPGVPVIALTASAIPSVREDICCQLRLENPRIFTGTFDRTNLHFRVTEKKQPEIFLAQYIGQHRQDSGIVYCMSRKECRDVADSLKKRGFPALEYHAGLSAPVRARVQDAFLNGTAKLICATVAFGMGINKPDVRYIIHYSMPKSLEAYYQETGRAGRDGHYSECILLYSHDDAVRVKNLISNDVTGVANLRRAQEKLQEMISYCEHTGCRRKFLLAYFGEEYPPENCGSCDTCDHPPDMIENTAAARLILSAITQFPSPPDSDRLIAVLRGWKGNRIIGPELAGLPAYGTGKRYPGAQYRVWIDELVRQGFLQVSTQSPPELIVTRKGSELLRGRLRVMLPPFSPPLKESSFLDLSGNLSQ